MSAVFPYFSEKDVFKFPDPDTATPEGIVGVGGNLSPGMLLSAYSQGIFPWFSETEPLLWWSPDPRFVVFPENVHVSASMRKLFKKNVYKFSLDKRFAEVIACCSNVPRKGQGGTWITSEMIDAYIALHKLGYAHSLEVYHGSELVGGLYGISLGKMFFGESMFSLMPNSSKSAFLVLAHLLRKKGFSLIDSQVHNPHVESLGGEEIPRDSYLEILRTSLEEQTIRGNWGDLLPQPSFPLS